MDAQTIELIEAAKKVRENAHSPISHFKVGAAVVGESGKIYSGCNVESVAFTNTTHGETNAIDTAIAAGEKKITKVLIVLDIEEPAYPCALCRQKIAEFSDNAEVIATTLKGKIKSCRILDLYPDPFLSF
ncbi:MAG: Cytidine deaminase [Candidatus Doudnabacteria bacterium]|nr:Cytidine deaminase [Candidatus Doudnabacteria bacterium]